jgi:hypothetical protein
MGTTSSCAFDPIRDIGVVCQKVIQVRALRFVPQRSVTRQLCNRCSLARGFTSTLPTRVPPSYARNCEACVNRTVSSSQTPSTSTPTSGAPPCRTALCCHWHRGVAVCVIALPLLCHGCTITLSSLYHCSVMAVPSLCHHCVIAVTSLYHRCVFAGCSSTSTAVRCG